jgi:peptidoglycan/LPS O-acetylase OafA/YrhL
MRIEQLTFTRFLAAIFIVIHHFGTSFFPVTTNPLSILVLEAPLFVSYFFVLSGFVMIVAYNNKEQIDSLKFIQKRFARIYPVYLLAIIILATYSYTQNGSYRGMLSSVLLMQAWIPGRATDFNAPAWSLSVEMLFYIVFPFLFNYFYKPKYIKMIAAATITIWIVTQVLFMIVFRNQHDNFLSCFPLMHLNEFLMGNLAGLLFVWKLQHRKANYDWLIILLVAALILALKYPPPYINYQDGMLAILYAPIIMALALNTGKLTSLFSLKPLVFLGEISYSIYILQVPVCYWCLAVLAHFHMGFTLAAFGAFLCILILISYLSYILIEIPLRERINKLGARKLATARIA